MHPKRSRDKTVQVKKLQVHCVQKFSTRACAEWAWTDGLCFQLRYGRTCKLWIVLATTKTQACEATMAHYNMLQPEMLGISSDIIRVQWQLPRSDTSFGYKSGSLNPCMMHTVETDSWEVWVCLHNSQASDCLISDIDAVLYTTMAMATPNPVAV